MKRAICTILILILASGCSQQGNSSENSSENDESYPSKLIEFIAPAAPGGGWDLTARSIQNTLTVNDLVEQDINVVNKPGGGGEVGFSYLAERDSHHLAINSSLLFTNEKLGLSDLSYQDFTPIATLSTEWQAIAVGPDSEHADAESLMGELKEDPKSIKVGVAPGLGNNDHLSFIQAAQTYGIDPLDVDFLVYESGGEVVTALLGGHIDAATMSVSEATEQYQADRIDILAVSSEERLEELPEVPTYTEEGIDLVFPHWRGIMGPPDMTEEEINYWEEQIAAMVETEEWQSILENNQWEDFHMNYEETNAFMEEQDEKYEELLTNAGLKD